MLLVSLAPASADLISYTWNENTAIPDGDLSGVAFTHTVDAPWYFNITDVQVNLNIAGQLNGDLYAYLSFNNDAAILLNRPGKTASAPYGYGDGGLNVTFSDSAGNGDIHIYRATLLGNVNTPLGGPLTGTWAPDGRLTSPLSVTATDNRTAALASFANQNPAGDWTLFVADASGGFTNAVVSWGLQINGQIPEPAAALLLALGLGGILLWPQKK